MDCFMYGNELQNLMQPHACRTLDSAKRAWSSSTIKLFLSYSKYLAKNESSSVVKILCDAVKYLGLQWRILACNEGSWHAMKDLGLQWRILACESSGTESFNAVKYLGMQSDNFLWLSNDTSCSSTVKRLQKNICQRSNYPKGIRSSLVIKRFIVQ